VGVVEVYEAITTKRPYQHPITVDDAIALLHRQVERNWLRQDVVEALASVVQKRTA
jgi:HD-GYP domain-containing protein (c-di-GMP phosphodiesterase class II)